MGASQPFLKTIRPLALPKTRVAGALVVFGVAPDCPGLETLDFFTIKSRRLKQPISVRQLVMLANLADVSQNPSPWARLKAQTPIFCRSQSCSRVRSRSYFYGLAIKIYP